MRLYDECLTGVSKLIDEYGARSLDIGESAVWKDAGKNQIIFQNDTAYELGGGTYPAVSSIALTDSADFVPRDEVLLIGDDLPDIKGDTPFARIALIRVDEESMGSGNALYQAVRQIEYARYRLNPEGYMMRISAFSHREAARVSSEALTHGLDFAKVGRLFIEEYKKRAQVEAVKLLFVTARDFPYEQLSAVMEKSEKITTALDHIMKDVRMDCSTCSLKDVCEEVEALCNKDFPDKK
ncbi:MAG: carbon monoxide dehydrogenase [Clostridia bacterium]|nr:carbon monoxide dehydrogenase [Clostridia bacterium]